MSLNKYAKLKAAGSILGFTMKEFADELNTYPQVVADVAEDRTTSARISKAIDEKIAEAERVWDESRNTKLTANQQ